MSQLNFSLYRTLAQLVVGFTSLIGSGMIMATDISDVYRVGIGPVCVEELDETNQTQKNTKTYEYEFVEEVVTTSLKGTISIMLDNSDSMKDDVRNAANLLVKYLEDNYNEVKVRDLWFVADDAKQYKPSSNQQAINLLNSVTSEEGSPLIEYAGRMAKEIDQNINNTNGNENDDLDAVIFFTDGESDRRGDKSEPPGYYINNTLKNYSQAAYGGRDCWEAYDDGLDWGGDPDDGTSLCAKLIGNMIAKKKVKFYFVNFGLDESKYEEWKVTQFWDHTVAKTGGKEIMSNKFNSSSIDTTAKDLLDHIWGVDIDTIVDTEITENNFKEMLIEPVSFVASANLAYSLDSSRRFHSSEVYLNVFRSNYFTYWPGNLFKYNVNANGKLVANNAGFTSPAAGSIKDLSTKGGDIGKNLLNYGTVSKLSYPRKVLTEPNSTGNLVNLKASDIPIVTPDSPMTQQDVLGWIKNNSMPEKKKTPLFNGSLTSDMEYINYDHSVNNKKYLFTTRLSGALHAVNAQTGKEKFVFFPKGFTNELEAQYANRQIANLSGDKSGEGLVENIPLGLDGPISAWVHDDNKNGKITGAKDFAHLYLTMRKQGKNIYALDVTNVDSPKLKWKIKGGVNSYKKLAQTWSRLTKTKVDIKGTVTDVLIATGGYDKTNNNGNAIFMINPSNGSVIWTASNVTGNKTFPKMNKSFPGGVRVVDVDSDGLADQFYAVDISGQVWRFDVSNGSAKSQLIKGGIIATLGGSGRQFYTTPSAYVSIADGKKKLIIAIGSGQFDNPLAKSGSNAVFVIYQNDVDSAPASYTKVTLNTLKVSDFSNQVKQGGFKFNLASGGEKVISDTNMFNDTLLFTTYKPPASTEPSTKAQCGKIPTNTARLYMLDLSNGKPSPIFEASGNAPAQYFKGLNDVAGVPPAPTVLKIKDNKGKAKYVGCVGVHCQKIEAVPPLTPTFWNVD